VTVRIYSNSVDILMPAGYAGEGIHRTVADGAVVMTLTALEEVDYVRLSEQGASVGNRPDRYLSRSDFLLTNASFERVDYTVTLWFLSQDGRGLASESRNVNLADSRSTEEIVLSALLAGPERADLRPAAPEGTRVLSASVEGEGCRIDLSGEFVSAASEDEGERRLALYSVVNTLCELSGVRSVHLTVEGQTLEFFGGVDTAGPLKADPSAVVS